jgi:hypothetical protein
VRKAQPNVVYSQIVKAAGLSQPEDEGDVRVQQDPETEKSGDKTNPE